MTKEREVIFIDPDKDIYDQWGKETIEYYNANYPEHTEAYAHPNGPNLQIAPYKGPRRTEFDTRTFLGEEPKTKQQKRKEELALGIS